MPNEAKTKISAKARKAKIIKEDTMTKPIVSNMFYCIGSHNNQVVFINPELIVSIGSDCACKWSNIDMSNGDEYTVDKPLETVLKEVCELLH